MPYGQVLILYLLLFGMNSYIVGFRYSYVLKYELNNSKNKNIKLTSWVFFVNINALIYS